MRDPRPGQSPSSSVNRRSSLPPKARHRSNSVCPLPVLLANLVTVQRRRSEENAPYLHPGSASVAQDLGCAPERVGRRF